MQTISFYEEGSCDRREFVNTSTVVEHICLEKNKKIFALLLINEELKVACGLKMLKV